MTTLTVNIDNKKTERAVKAVLDALDVSYDERPALTKAQKKVYDNLKNSFEQIKLHQEGKIELRDAKELLNEL